MKESIQFIVLINTEFVSAPNMKKGIKSRDNYHIYNKRIISKVMDCFHV